MILLALLCCPAAVADLHDAILSGDLERVRQEIAGGANINQPDQMGATPLHDVAWSGNLEIARFLLDHGASVKARHAEGGSQPLAYACIKNDLRMVELLLSYGADLRAADNSGATPLHLAVDRGYQQLAALLIVRGSDVKVRDKAGSAPLDEAARRGFRGIAELLIQHGAPVDQADPTTGSTPLNEAARRGHRDVVGLLLEKGADPKRRDKAGTSPIENAARGRHAEALELLIAATGPAAAEIGALLTESAIKGQTDIADLLIAKGANVEARDKSGATPLHQAALKGNRCVRYSAVTTRSRCQRPRWRRSDAASQCRPERTPRVGRTASGQGRGPRGAGFRVRSHSALSRRCMGPDRPGGTAYRPRCRYQRQKQGRRHTARRRGKERLRRNCRRPQAARGAVARSRVIQASRPVWFTEHRYD